jgi:predicted acetyltransferase
MGKLFCILSAARTEMQLALIEQQKIEPTSTRRKWVEDPAISAYISFDDTISLRDGANTLSGFQKYFEIYDADRHVGDIKVFYETEEDIFEKRAQLLMIVGERNKGIGKSALKILLGKLRESYNSVYCIIQRSNIASLKMLKFNGFEIENIEDQNIRLRRSL